MTIDEVVTLVLNRCGNRSGDSGLTSAALLELKMLQGRLEEAPDPPWFLISERADGEVTQSEPRLELPSDFLMELEEGALFLVKGDGTEKELKKDEYDRLRRTYLNTEEGEPEWYTIRGKYIYLFPTPDAAYEVRLVYYKRDTAPATGVTNEWSTYAADVLIAELGMVISGEYLKDERTRKQFETDLAIARKRLKDKNIARGEVNMLNQMR